MKRRRHSKNLSCCIIQTNAHGVRLTIHLTWQIPAQLAVCKPFIQSMSFATFIIEDTDKSELEYFLLAGYMKKKKNPVMQLVIGILYISQRDFLFTEGYHAQLESSVQPQAVYVDAYLWCTEPLIMLVCVSLPWPLFLPLLHCILCTGSDNEQSSPRGTISFLMCLI